MSSLFDTGIRPAVDAWLLAKSKEVRSYGDYWSASSAGYCMRKVIFERLGVPKIESDGDARKQRVFTSGHLFHAWLQSITKEAGLSIAQELELQDEELMIRGHIDDLILIEQPIYDPNPIVGKDSTGATTVTTKEYPPRQHLILYDYKTQNSRAFSYKRPEMSHYHKMQLGTYMYMLRRGSYGVPPNEHTTGYNEGHMVGKENFFAYPQLSEARILKISKDDLRMTEEQLLWTPTLEKEVYEYWATLNGYWKSRKLPKCTCADREGGFMAREAYNDYFYDGEPCSIKWLEKWKAEHETV